LIWMGKAADPASFVLAAAVNQIGCGMLLPTLLTWATRGLAFELRGRGNGAWQSTFAVGQFLSGVLVTFLAEHVGGLLPAFIILGTASAVAATVALASQWLFAARLATPLRQQSRVIGSVESEERIHLYRGGSPISSISKNITINSI
jgi:MFS family permease